MNTFNKYFPNGKIEYPIYEKADPTYERPTLRTRTEPVDWNGNKPSVDRHYQLLNDAEKKNRDRDVRTSH